MAFGYGVLVSALTSSYVFVFLGSIGFTVATIETYKTFFFPDRPRGKFQGKEPEFPEYLERRKRFVPLYVLVWASVIAAIVVAFAQPRDGLLF